MGSAQIQGDASKSGFDSVIVVGPVAIPNGGIKNTKNRLLLSIGDFGFARTGVQYVLDYNSVWLPLAANEPGFTGARRVKNWCLWSEDPVLVTNADDGATAYGAIADTLPSGASGQTFRIVTATSNQGRYLNEAATSSLHGGATLPATGTLLPGTEFAVRFDAKISAGSGATWDIYQRNVGGYSASESGNWQFVPADGWSTYSSTFFQCAAYQGFGTSIKTVTAAAAEMRVARLQFEDLSGEKGALIPSEYVPSGSAPGVKWFASQRGTSRTNPAYVATHAALLAQKNPANIAGVGGVVTDGSGSALTGMKGYWSEAAATNLLAAYTVPNNAGFAKCPDAGTGARALAPFTASNATAVAEVSSMWMVAAATDIVFNNTTHTITSTTTNFLTAGFQVGQTVLGWDVGAGSGEWQGPATISVVSANSMTVSGTLVTRSPAAAHLFRVPGGGDNIIAQLNDGSWHATTLSGAITPPAVPASITYNYKALYSIPLTAAPASNGGYASSDNSVVAYFWTSAADFGVTVSGGTGPTIKLVSDKDAIVAAGLGYLNPTGLVYELYGGTSGNATFKFGAASGGTASRDTVPSIYAKKISGGSNPFLQFPSHTGSVNLSGTTDYTRYSYTVTNSGGSVNTDGSVNVVVQAGVTVRVILPQLEQGAAAQASDTRFASSPVVCAGAAASRTATVLSKAWGSTKDNNIAGSITWTPVAGALAQAQAIWSLYADASNYLELFIAGSTVTFRKRAQGTNYDATASHTPVAGTSVTFAWAIDQVNGVTLSVDGIAGTPNADVRSITLSSAALHQVGSHNSGNQAYGSFSNLTVG